jgi:hypothetical protein
MLRLVRSIEASLSRRMSPTNFEHLGHARLLHIGASGPVLFSSLALIYADQTQPSFWSFSLKCCACNGRRMGFGLCK